MDLTQLATVGAALVVVLGACWAAWRKWLRGPWHGLAQFFGRVDETINGRPADIDAWGHQRAAAVPSLGERMTSLEAAVRDQASFDERLTDVEKRVTAIEGGHHVERSLSHIAQAKVVDAIAEANRRPGYDHDVAPES